MTVQIGEFDQLFSALLEHLQPPRNLKQQKSRIRVGLLDQLIRTGIPLTEFGVELECDRLLYRVFYIIKFTQAASARSRCCTCNTLYVSIYSNFY